MTKEEKKEALEKIKIACEQMIKTIDENNFKRLNYSYIDLKNALGNASEEKFYH